MLPRRPGGLPYNLVGPIASDQALPITLTRVPQVTNAPVPSALSSADVFQNLLLLTLIASQPFVQSMWDASPPLKYQVQCEQFQSRVLIGIPQPIPLFQFVHESEKPKYQIQCDAYPNTLIEGIAVQLPFAGQIAM